MTCPLDFYQTMSCIFISALLQFLQDFGELAVIGPGTAVYYLIPGHAGFLFSEYGDDVDVLCGIFEKGRI